MNRCRKEHGRASPWMMLGACLGWFGIVLFLNFSSRNNPAENDVVRIAVVPSVMNLPILLLGDATDPRIGGASVELVRVADADLGRELLSNGQVDIFVNDSASDANTDKYLPLTRYCGCSACAASGYYTGWQGENAAAVVLAGCSEGNCARHLVGHVRGQTGPFRLVVWCSLVSNPGDTLTEQMVSISETMAAVEGESSAAEAVIPVPRQFGVFAVSQKLLETRPQVIEALSEQLALTYEAINSGEMNWRSYLLRQGLWRSHSPTVRVEPSDDDGNGPTCAWVPNVLRGQVAL